MCNYMEHVHVYLERYVNTCADTYLVQMYGFYEKGEQGTIIKNVILKVAIIKKLLSKGYV